MSPTLIQTEQQANELLSNSKVGLNRQRPDEKLAMGSAAKRPGVMASNCFVEPALEKQSARKQGGMSQSGFAHLTEALGSLNGLIDSISRATTFHLSTLKKAAGQPKSTDCAKEAHQKDKEPWGINWPHLLVPIAHKQEANRQSGVAFVTWKPVASKGQHAGTEHEYSESAKTAPAEEFTFFGMQVPEFPPAFRKPSHNKVIPIARITANPLLWVTKQGNSKAAPAMNKEESTKMIPSATKEVATKSEGASQGTRPQLSESGPGTASQLLGQTEAVLDSVKSAVAGISSNVMDNLPPLRKTTYPDRKKLSSVQEFYRYTEAEGRRLFEELDGDGDGQVTLEDLEAAMRRRKLPQEYARKFLRKVRRTLFAKSFTWAEFLALMDEREPAILRAYNSLDLNSAGTLQRNQIKASLQRNGLPTTDRNINAMMRFLTGEADGQIAYGQFRNFLLLLPPERLRDHPSTVWFEAATVVPLYAPAVATGSVLKSALAGGLACAIPTFFLHPVDTMKTRVQASTMSLRDLVDQLPEIGARGLYRGAVPAIVGQFAGQGLRTGMLEASKAVLKNVAPDLPEMQVQSLASFTSTFMGTALRIPCEVMKQRCQAGMYDNWQAAMVGTYRTDGLTGFFRGTTATLLREVPFYVAGMMIYEQIKKGVRIGIRRELKPWETITVGGVSGGLAAVTTTPFDVVKTRMMTAEPGLANGMGATFMHILKNEGVMALYKGALPRFFWIAPLGAMNFAGYELAKRAMEDQDKKKAREVEAAAEEELRALEAAEELRRRAPFSRLPSLPNFGDRLPQLESRFSELRKRLPKLRKSEAVDGRKAEVSDGLLRSSGEAKTFADGSQGQKEEGTSALAVAAQLSRPAESVKGEMIGGRKGQETLLREKLGNQGLEKEAVLEAKGEKALPARKTGGSGSHYELVGSETRPESVTEEKREGWRRGFLKGMPVPGIFRRPRSATPKKDNQDVGPLQDSAREAMTKDGKESTAESATKQDEAERSKEQELGDAEKGKLREGLEGFSGSRSSGKTGDSVTQEDRQGTRSGKLEKGLGEKVDIVTEEDGRNPESTASKRG